MEYSSSIEVLVKVENTPPTDQKQPSSGPFLLVKGPKIDGGGLSWVGVPERCDRCGKEYPMSWITLSEDGKRLLCAECDFDVAKLQGSEYSQECDLCHNDFSIHEMTIEYNQLVCKHCSYNAAEHKQQTFEQHKKVRGEYDHLFED